jgi:hypothetical protein
MRKTEKNLIIILFIFILVLPKGNKINPENHPCKNMCYKNKDDVWTFGKAIYLTKEECIDRCKTILFKIK